MKMDAEIEETEYNSVKNLADKEETKNDNESAEEEMQVDQIQTGRISAAPGATIQFKKPLLVGPRKAANKLAKSKVLNNQPDNADNDLASADDKDSNTHTVQLPKKPEKSPAEKIAENTIPVPYKEPKWSGLPKIEYSFEVLKSGTIVETINLVKKPYHVFGRLGNCDIVMAHPTVSRFHAVMQYRLEGDDKHGPGYYIYDLGSTHGTFLNKNRIKPNMYVRVQVGQFIKLGMSSRNFILQGPQDDEEPESELSVTELKELRLKEELAEKQRIMREELEEEMRRKKEEEEGIDWGMGEDADEATDLTENPFATPQNEQLYINDPKKTLRSWFEREGYDLEYNCQEKSFGQFICKIELPIDNSKGLPVVAEATVRGKKKEAIVQCALEACRILDQYGLLRQSNHESKKRKAKNWEDNDYYDSDDDTFLDRTGTVEKKRQLRMEQAGVKSSKEIHTYESLIERHKNIVMEIQKLEALMKEFDKSVEEKKKKEEEEENEDELDAFMSNLAKADDDKGKKNLGQLKAKLLSLKQEETSVRNLANVAKPAELPQLKPFNLSQSSGPVQKTVKMPIFGKKRATKKPLTVFAKFEEDKSVVDNGGEEVDSD